MQVRSTDASWHETRRLLRKDQRWSLAELLESADKERLFRDHVEALTERKRKAFRRLLEETPQVCHPTQSEVPLRLTTPPPHPLTTSPHLSQGYSHLGPNVNFFLSLPPSLPPSLPFPPSLPPSLPFPPSLPPLPSLPPSLRSASLCPGRRLVS